MAHKPDCTFELFGGALKKQPRSLPHKTFTTELLIKAKKRKQLKCASADELTNKTKY